MKKLVRTMVTCSIAALGALAIPTVASAGPAQTEQVGTTTQAVHGARERMFERALDQVQLRQDQKDAIDRLRSEAEQRQAPVQQARSALMVKVADQLESASGKVNRCELKSEIGAVASAVARVRPADRKAFEQLHQILDEGQRADFVDALKREVATARKAHQPGPIVDKMGKELGLTADQKDSLKRIITGLKEIREAEPAFDQHRDTWNKILEAFKTDNFNLDEVAPMGDVQANVTEKIEGRLWAAEAIIPVLTPQQRATAAKRLRSRAQHVGDHHHQQGSGSTTTLQPGED